MSDSDLVRRGDVLALCSKRMREYQDRMATAEREEDAGAYNAAYFRADELNRAAKLVNTLPADPVAAAAVALAEFYVPADDVIRTERVHPPNRGAWALRAVALIDAYREARRTAKGGPNG